MYIHNIEPTILHLGPLQIRWYGLVYVLGFLFVLWWLNFYRKKGELSLEKEEVSDFAFYLMIGVIIGSRIFEVFWNPSYYLSNPLRFFKVWEGGMSFHGGFVGILTACWWFCKKKKLNFLKMADILSLPTIVALALGRVANFINGQLWGRPFSGSWCVNFKKTGGGDVCRHPSTLYAAGKRFLVAGWILLLSLRNSFKTGFIFWNFVLFEGLGRIIVDFYREDVLWLNFTIGQWFSLVMVLVAVWFLLRYYGNEWKKVLPHKQS